MWRQVWSVALIYLFIILVAIPTAGAALLLHLAISPFAAYFVRRGYLRRGWVPID